MHAVYGEAKAHGAVTRRHARERRHPQFAAAEPARDGAQAEAHPPGVHSGGRRVTSRAEGRSPG